MQQMQHYVLFPNHDNSIRLYRELKAIGVRAVISPTPRAVSMCCGVSLMVEEKDLQTIRACAEEHDIEILRIAEIERDINPTRGRYC